MGSKFHYSYWPTNYCKAFSTIFVEYISCTISCVQQMIYTQITPTEKTQTGHHRLPAIFLEISSLLKTTLYVRVIFFSFWKGYYFRFQLCRPLFSLDPPNDLTAWVAMGVLCTWWQKTRLLICIVETRIWGSWTLLRLNKIMNVSHALQMSWNYVNISLENTNRVKQSDRSRWLPVSVRQGKPQFPKNNLSSALRDLKHPLQGA